MLFKNERFIVIALMYIIGVLHWYLFINLGDPTWKNFDWPQNYQGYDVIKQALLSWEMPYHATMWDMEIKGLPIQEGTQLGKHYPVRWFAMGNLIIRSPQIILLGFVSIPAFMAINLIFLYTIGFVGIVKWINKLRLSSAASAFLIMIWSFNGYIVAQMGVGNMVFNGAYLFVPLYFWLLYRFIEKDNMSQKENVSILIAYALFLFFCSLNNSFHVISQFVTVGFIVVLFYPKKLFWYTSSLVLAFILMSFFIWPTVLFSPLLDRGRTMYPSSYGWSGYGVFDFGKVEFIQTTENIFFNDLVIPINIFLNTALSLWKSLTVQYTAANDGVWEANLYVSSLATILVIGGCFFAIKKYKNYFSFRRYYFVYLLLFTITLGMISISRLTYLGKTMLGGSGSYFTFYEPRNSLMIKPTVSLFDQIWLDLIPASIFVIFSAILIIFIFSKYFNHFKKIPNQYTILIIPFMILVLFGTHMFYFLLTTGFNKFFDIITTFRPPVIDRISSRMMIYPISFALLISSIGFDQIFNKLHKSMRVPLVWSSLLIVLVLLMTHSYGWSAFQSDIQGFFSRSPEDYRNQFKTVIYDIEGDSFYKVVVITSFLFSWIVAIISGTFYIILRKK